MAERRPLAVLRPEPGNSATAARITALGAVAIKLPLFAVRPLDWDIPDPALFDALLLTSANTVRLAGKAGLSSLQGLPVLAVGPATAGAARAAGLSVALTGWSGAAQLLQQAQGYSRLLHLAGRERTLETGGPVAQVIPVYASVPLAVDTALLDGAVALVHSPRAGRRLAELMSERARVAVAAISPAALAACGEGWAGQIAAEAPTDAALISSGFQVIDSSFSEKKG